MTDYMLYSTVHYAHRQTRQTAIMATATYPQHITVQHITIKDNISYKYSNIHKLPHISVVYVLH